MELRIPWPVDGSKNTWKELLIEPEVVPLTRSYLAFPIWRGEAADGNGHEIAQDQESHS